VSPIRLERIVPLDVPDAAVCEDGVCEIPEPGVPAKFSADGAAEPAPL
jgi:hypothetical protein